MKEVRTAREAKVNSLSLSRFLRKHKSPQDFWLISATDSAKRYRCFCLAYDWLLLQLFIIIIVSSSTISIISTITIIFILLLISLLVC